MKKTRKNSRIGSGITSAQHVETAQSLRPRERERERERGSSNEVL